MVKPHLVISFVTITIILLAGCTKDYETIEIINAHQLEKVINSEYKRMQMPGLSVVSVNKHGVIYQGGVGFANVESQLPFTPQTRIQIASVSKLIVSIAVMQLFESGLIDLDTDVCQYLPFQVLNPEYPHKPITVRMLLTHSSSINDADFIFNNMVINSNHDFPKPLETFLMSYLCSNGNYFTKHNYLNQVPGNKWQYSNIGVSLAALIVQEQSGKDFNEYCKSYIFYPLGMHSTTWRYSETTISELAIPYSGTSRKTPKYPHRTYPDYPSGHLISTADDLSKFLYMLIKGGVNEIGIPIISQSTLASIMKVHRSDIDLPNPPTSIYNFGARLKDQGLLFFKGEIGGYKLWGHSGDDLGISTELYVDLENHIGYIMLNNRTWAHSPVIGKSLLDFAYNN